MKVSDEVMLHGSIDDVWQAINDPAVLVRTIPGCELLEVTGPDRYRIVVSAGVAAIRGTYSGEGRDARPAGADILRAHRVRGGCSRDGAHGRCRDAVRGWLRPDPAAI
jgi:carbon monoxide dehydrogenase subunit G